MAKPFIEIPQEQLFALADKDEGVERVIRYIHEARRAGRPDLAADAVIALITSQEKIIRGYAGKKLPASEVDDATAGAIEVLVKAVHRNPPESVNIAQLRGWMRTIVNRYCDGIFRTQSERIRMKQTHSIDGTYDDGTPVIDTEHGELDNGYEHIEYMEIVERQLELLSDDHRIVIRYSVFMDMTSKEVAEVLADEHDLTFQPNNIDQIASRFRRNCQGDIEEQ
jgi:RNA polymerase sigma factor (sigma-70 family)